MNPEDTVSARQPSPSACTNNLHDAILLTSGMQVTPFKANDLEEASKDKAKDKKTEAQQLFSEEVKSNHT